MLVILSGTRMAIFAAGVLLFTYAALSPHLRKLPLRRRWLTGAAVVLVAVVAALYWPYLRQHLFDGDSATLEMSSRDEIWSFYLQELRQSPLFGRGSGAGYIAGAEGLSDLWRTTPHNEYLHFLVEGGAVGFGVCLAAIGFWYRQLLQAVGGHDRVFILALAPALAVYAFTVDLLIYWAGLALYAYLGVLAAYGRAAAPLPEMRRQPTEAGQASTTARDASMLGPNQGTQDIPGVDRSHGAGPVPARAQAAAAASSRPLCDPRCDRHEADSDVSIVIDHS